MGSWNVVTVDIYVFPIAKRTGRSIRHWCAIVQIYYFFVKFNFYFSLTTIFHYTNDMTELQVVLLPERDYVTFGSLLSQFRLSSVCLSVTLVHPTQGVEAFGNISSPLCTLAIL